MTDASVAWDRLLELPARDRSGSWVWPGTGPSKRMFGGQVIAQAMAVAASTVAGGVRPASIHTIFLRPADASRPIGYRVGELRTGRAFATRVVQAEQDGRVVAHATSQWHVPESWLSHNDVITPPAIPSDPQPLPYPAPGVLTDLLDLRWTDAPGGRGLWFRLRAGDAVRADWHAYIACYVSDLWLGDTALRRHGQTWDSTEVRASSVAHGVWIHRAVDVAEWTYIGSSAPVCEGGRAFVAAALRTATGELAMTIQQDVSVRSKVGRAAPAAASLGRGR
jgi:acyl-CoA thioesterase-2